MYSSQKTDKDIIFKVYNDSRTVFKLNDIAMLLSETNFESLSKRINYYVQKGKLLNPRKGIYAKSGYNILELACVLYTPSYISLEYVLQKSGITFQYDSQITSVSYLSRKLEIEGFSLSFRKIKNEILVNTSGIIAGENMISIATPERALLDTLYLNSNYYFDNMNPLNVDLIYKLLPIYQSNTLNQRVKKLFKS